MLQFKKKKCVLCFVTRVCQSPATNGSLKHLPNFFNMLLKGRREI